MTFQAIADPDGQLLEKLGQEVIWWKLGRMPLLLGLDAAGTIQYRHSGRSMQDLPNFEEAMKGVLHDA